MTALAITGNRYSGPYTATAAQTDFTVTFPVIAASNSAAKDALKVIVDGVDQDLSTWSFSGNETGVSGEYDGGTLTAPSGMTGGEEVFIYSNLEPERDTNFIEGAGFPAETQDLALNKLAASQKDIHQQIPTFLRRPYYEFDVGDMELPKASVRAQKYLYFESDGSVGVATALASGTLSRSSLGGFLYPQTADEVSAGVTPTDYAYYPGDVRRYGADPTGAVSSTTAFTNALAANNVIFVQPASTYLVEDVGLTEGKAVICIGGFWSTGARLFCGTAGASMASPKTIFTVDTDSDDVQAIFLYGLTLDTDEEYVFGVHQTDRSNYIANMRVRNCDFRASLTRSFNGYFILTQWQDCRDGYAGTPPAATHQFIRSEPATSGQAKQSNKNVIKNCNIYGANATDGAIYAEWGGSWDLVDVDAEQLSCDLMVAAGIRDVFLTRGWCERITSAQVITAEQDSGSNQGTTVHVDSTKFGCSLTTTTLVACSNSCFAGFRNYTLLEVPSGFSLTTYGGIDNAALLYDENGLVQSGVDPRPVLAFGTSVLPISRDTFSTPDWTRVSSTSTLSTGTSTLGLRTNTLTFQLDTDGSGLYFDVPSALVTYLRGQTLTFSVIGHGDSSGNSVAVFACCWQDVGSPTFDNHTSATASYIDAGGSAMEASSVQVFVGSTASTLRFGIRAGGVAGGPVVSLEAVDLVLGFQPKLI